MEVEQILEALKSRDGHFPSQALVAAVKRREALAPALLEVLDEACRDPDSLLRAEGCRSHVYALYLLAQFRDTRAYDKVIRFFSLPAEVCVDQTGDCVTNDLHRILASVCGGDLTAIQALIENRAVNEWVRAAAVEALKTLVLAGLAERDQVVGYLGSLFRDRLEREPSETWNELVAAAADLHPAELMEEIRAAYRDDLVDSQFIALDEVDEKLSSEPESVLEEARFLSAGLIDDAVKDLESLAVDEEELPGGDEDDLDLDGDDED